MKAGLSGIQQRMKQLILACWGRNPRERQPPVSPPPYHRQRDVHRAGLTPLFVAQVCAATLIKSEGIAALLRQTGKQTLPAVPGLAWWNRVPAEKSRHGTLR